MIIDWIKSNPITGYFSLIVMALAISIHQYSSQIISINLNITQTFQALTLPEWIPFSFFLVCLIIILPYFFKNIGLNSKYYHVYSFVVFIGLANSTLKFDFNSAFGLLLILGGLSKLFKTFNEKIVKVDLLETGVLLSLACFIDKTYILFLPIIALGLIIIRSFKISELINLIFSFVFTYLGGLALIFILNNEINYTNYFPDFNKPFTGFIMHTSILIYLVYLGLLVFRLMFRSKYLNIKSQQIHNVLFWSFFILSGLIFTKYNGYGIIAGTIIFSATSFTNFLKGFKKPLIKDFTLGIVIFLMFLANRFIF